MFDFEIESQVILRHMLSLLYDCGKPHTVTISESGEEEAKAYVLHALPINLTNVMCRSAANVAASILS